MGAIRVAIADDHVFYREGVKTMLATRSDAVEIVGEAATGDEAVELVRALRPGVVLMDLKMPGMHGIEATRRVVAAYPETAVLVLTMFDDDSVFAAMRAGARGYLLKDAGIDDLMRAITAVDRGEAIFSPATARRLTQFFARTTSTGPPELFPELTDRERSVLDLIVRGTDNAGIAERLHLTPKTVRNYISTILAKLHVHDRSQAIVKAHEAGFPPRESDSGREDQL